MREELTSIKDRSLKFNNKMKKQYIYTDDDIYNDEYREEAEESMKEINGDDFEFTDVSWAEYVQEQIGDEQSNLDCEVDGVVMAFASLGLWNGCHTGSRILTENVNSIFQVNEDHNEWYGDGYNIKGRFAHHDGTNNVLFRVVKDRETAERFAEQIYLGKMDEAKFRKRTRSLYPYVARIYGWSTKRFDKKGKRIS